MEEDTGIEIKELKVDGGASSNNFLMRFQADIMRKKLLRPVMPEATALGAAFLAGLASGFWRDKKELCSKWKSERCFSPKMNEEQRVQLIAGWHKAVKVCLT
jgi:glycerol kinase